MTKWSAEFIEFMSDYTHYLCDIMNLNDWTVSLQEGPPSNAGYGAEVTTSYGKRKVELRIRRNLLSEDWEVFRLTMFHEFSHIVMSPLDFHTQPLEGLLGQPVWHMWKQGYTERNEHVVEAFAEIISSLVDDGENNLKFKERWGALLR